jgi:hypothetical protein
MSRGGAGGRASDTIEADALIAPTLEGAAISHDGRRAQSKQTSRRLLLSAVSRQCRRSLDMNEFSAQAYIVGN